MRPKESQSVNRVPILRLGGMEFECLKPHPSDVAFWCSGVDFAEWRIILEQHEAANRKARADL